MMGESDLDRIGLAQAEPWPPGAAGAGLSAQGVRRTPRSQPDWSVHRDGVAARERGHHLHRLQVGCGDRGGPPREVDSEPGEPTPDGQWSTCLPGCRTAGQLRGLCFQMGTVLAPAGRSVLFVAKASSAKRPTRNLPTRCPQRQYVSRVRVIRHARGVHRRGSVSKLVREIVKPEVGYTDVRSPAYGELSHAGV
jgi:hypothetical protein